MNMHSPFELVGVGDIFAGVEVYRDLMNRKWLINSYRSWRLLIIVNYCYILVMLIDFYLRVLIL